MISDRLYDAAFQYKKTKLWKDLWDTELFAVKMQDGETGYISIMGMSGEYCALGVYIGEEGYQSFRKIAGERPETMTFFQQHEFALSQNCCQMVLCQKDELSEEELADVRRYAKANGIRLAGKNAYPQFVKHTPFRYPWKLQSRQDEEYVYQALMAAITLADLLVDTAPFELGIREVTAKTSRVLLMELVDGRYRFTGSAVLPKEKKKAYAAPRSLNEIGIRSLKKFPKRGVWECEVILFPGPIQDTPQEAPYFSHALMTVESRTQYILPPELTADYETHPEDMVNHFIDMLIGQKMMPEMFLVRDERTCVLLQKLAEKLGVSIIIQKDLPALDDAEESLLEHLDTSPEEEQEELLMMAELLLQMDDEDVKNMPEEVLEPFRMLLNMGALPEELTKKLAKKLGI